MDGLTDFLAKRKKFTSEFFPCPGSKKTVLLSSYIWWTELIAYALLRLGYNVLVAEPWYAMWLNDSHWQNFDTVYRQWVGVIKKMNVQLVIGGNSTISVPHPVTKELLHRAAGVPAVSYWWDEPRNMPPMTQRGLTAEDHLAAMRDDRTLNVFWDDDMRQEMARFYGITNSMHVPLGATPEFWQTANRPLAQRPTKLCFLGNNHDDGGWETRFSPEVIEWARRVGRLKLADLDRAMVDCVEEVGTPAGGIEGVRDRTNDPDAGSEVLRRPGSNVAESGSSEYLRTGVGRTPPGNEPTCDKSGASSYRVAANLKDEFSRWHALDMVLVSECRNAIVKAAAGRAGQDMVLIGKGWDRLGLKAQAEHSGVPKAKDFYVSSQASLNLFGGCVHGGMPLRPYEIAAANGLLFTQYNRELPGLFEPGKQCVAFRNPDEMIEQLNRILAAPAEFDAVVEAGRRRVVAEHTWERRLSRILDHAKERFDLPW